MPASTRSDRPSPGLTAAGFLAYGLDCPPTGIASYTRGLLAGFHSIGFSPLLLLSGGLSGFPAGSSGANGFRFLPLPGSRRLPLLLTLGQAQIAILARRFSLRLLHDPTGAAPLLLAPARRILTLHDAFPLSFPGCSALLESLLYRCWLPAALPHVDAVITVSAHSKQDLERCLHIPANKITVVPLAPASCFRRFPPGELTAVLSRCAVPRPYILSVGALAPRKNPIRLLRAFALLRRSFPRLHLVLAGKPNPRLLAAAARRSPPGESLLQSVICTGSLPLADLPALYSGASLFCFPSLYEGFGLPVLEAMACGAPVVASSTSSLPEVAGDAALLVDPYDVEAIADAMGRILTDSNLAEDLCLRGLQRAALFSWERTARSTIAVYQSVLGEPIL